MLQLLSKLFIKQNKTSPTFKKLEKNFSAFLNRARVIEQAPEGILPR